MTTTTEYRTTLDGRDVRVRGKNARECAWLLVLAHWRQLCRISQAMARKGVQLDPEEVLHDLCADVVQSFHLWDPARGTWLAWARTRSRLVRITQIRHRDRHGDGNLATPWGRRVAFGPDPDGDGPAVDPATGAGAWGTAARCEALVDAQAIYDRADDAGRDAMLSELHGFRMAREDGRRPTRSRHEAAVDDALAVLR